MMLCAHLLPNAQVPGRSQLVHHYTSKALTIAVKGGREKGCEGDCEVGCESGHEGSLEGERFGCDAYGTDLSAGLRATLSKPC